MKLASRLSIAWAAVATVVGPVAAWADEDDYQEASRAVAQLYELQASFHEAASGAGVDATIKAKHLRDMLAIFTDDAVLIVGTATYAGLGEPGSSSCAPGSLTLCDFFQNHAGSFVPGRNWAALTNLSATHFDVHGKRAEVYFECHYLDLATATKVSDVSFGLRDQPETGQARRVGGKWLLSFAVVGSPALSTY
jgi:hypothetical protein